MKLTDLLLWTQRWLPPQRRDWIEALVAEADDVPSGRTRLVWLLGGLWLIAREARMIRRLAYLTAGLAGGAFLVRLGWHDGSANPAAPMDRFMLIASAVVLAGAPILVPVAASRTARVVRTIMYGALCGFYIDMVFLSRFSGARFDDFDPADRDGAASMRISAVLIAVMVIGMFGAYAAAILRLTSRHSTATPRMLVVATGSGVAAALVVYALMPFGGLLDIGHPALNAFYGVSVFALPLAAFWLAGRLGGDVRRGTLGGLYAGGIGALVLAVCTITTMLLLPHHVPLEWANPDPAAVHGTDFEWRMSVGDGAVKYQALLLFGPIIGLFFAAIGASFQPEDKSGAGEVAVP